MEKRHNYIHLNKTKWILEGFGAIDARTNIDNSYIFMAFFTVYITKNDN